MSRSTRVGGGVAIATIVLLYAIIEHGRTLRAERALHVLPKTARAVLRINPSALANSESALALFDWLVPAERLSEIEARCGLDPLAALSDVTVWVGGPEGESFQSVGLLLQGRTVDSETLAECYRTLVEARGSAIDRVATSTGPLLRSRDGRSALAQVDEHTVVTGSTDTVAEFMAVGRGAVAPLFEEARFRDIWSRMAIGAAIAGAFVAPPRWQSAFERIGAVSDQASALAGVEGLGFTTEAEIPTAITVVLDVKDSDIARRDVALMEVWMESPPDTIEPYWVDIARSAQIEVDGALITLTLDVSGLPKRP
ncbi:MAG: hypothetical protein O7F08_03140 [Deltaproteobacteria bacterium]|nr:hypothetical protein [Deltaproteobacteria bacterium]